MSKSYSIPEIVMKELEDRRADWRIKKGSKHGKLIVNGVFCGILSCGKGSDDVRFVRNLRSQVRRALDQ